MKLCFGGKVLGTVCLRQAKFVMPPTDVINYGFSSNIMQMWYFSLSPPEIPLSGPVRSSPPKKKLSKQSQPKKKWINSCFTRHSSTMGTKDDGNLLKHQYLSLIVADFMIAVIMNCCFTWWGDQMLFLFFSVR